MLSNSLSDPPASSSFIAASVLLFGLFNSNGNSPRLTSCVRDSSARYSWRLYISKVYMRGPILIMKVCHKSMLLRDLDYIMYYRICGRCGTCTSRKGRDVPYLLAVRTVSSVKPLIRQRCHDTSCVLYNCNYSKN